MEKIFKNLDEQIEILKFKGLRIDNIDFTREVLLRENYFFINGYRHLFMTDNGKRFTPGTTFEELYSLFLFDRSFRNILFKNLLIIENNIKSIISYQLSKKYGFKEKDYLKESNFTTDYKEKRRVEDVINKMKRQIRVNGEKHSATYHYITNYGYIPMWILVKVLSFGLINELYGILKLEDKVEIAKVYNLNPETFKIYLELLSNYRNLCAHEDIVYEHKTQTIIPDTKYHELLNIKKIDDIYVNGKNDIFAVILIIKQMLSKDKFNDLMNEINGALNKFDSSVKTISKKDIIKKMGFPDNYNELINIEVNNG
jgi:abortive infection bacteriophage resistance protein